MHAQRLIDEPIITASMSRSLIEQGDVNINGPSLIRTPDWLPNAMGRYYLYFAHHQGTNIRLAYADALTGPWTIHEPGSLQLAQTPFPEHIASPDVHIDEVNRRVVMYYHGCCRTDASIPWEQYTCVATSPNGIDFTSDDTPLANAYLRCFDWQGVRYGISAASRFWRSGNGFDAFEECENTFPKLLCLPGAYARRTYRPRHFAVQLRGDRLCAFFSRVGDCPEHIVYTDIELAGDWTRWQPTVRPVSLLKPERDWEGADREHIASVGGACHDPVWQLRDPAIYEEAGRTFLLYSVAGEQGIGIAELVE